jgi:proteic killer suppression protein
MIVSFKDKATEDIFNGLSSKAARQSCPQTLWRIAGRKLDQLDSVIVLDELKVPPGNRLEPLTGDKKGQQYQNQSAIPSLFCLDRAWTQPS